MNKENWMDGFAWGFVMATLAVALVLAIVDLLK